MCTSNTKLWIPSYKALFAKIQDVLDIKKHSAQQLDVKN